MWLELLKLSDAHCEPYSIIGKALLLCQNFERNFRHFFMNRKLAHALSENQIEHIFDERWNAIVAEVTAMLLGSQLKQYGARFESDVSILERLDSGRLSRNVIVHESAVIMRESIRTGETALEELDMLLSHIERVGRADHIVSVWDWHLNESEPVPFSEGMYLRKITDWIRQ